MKSHLYYFCGALTLLASLSHRAPAVTEEELAAVGPLPSHRQGQVISPQEQNPFASKAKSVTTQTKGIEEETQESKIRKIFSSLSVTGIRLNPAGRSMALVGDIILREGERVAPVLPDQTETLIVSQITRNRVDLAFLETKEATQPRTITLKVDQTPRVHQLLSGQNKGRQMYVPHAERAAQAGRAAAEAVTKPRPFQSGTELETEDIPAPAETSAVEVTSPPPATPDSQGFEAQ